MICIYIYMIYLCMILYDVFRNSIQYAEDLGHAIHVLCCMQVTHDCSDCWSRWLRKRHPVCGTPVRNSPQYPVQHGHFWPWILCCLPLTFLTFRRKFGVLNPIYLQWSSRQSAARDASKASVMQQKPTGCWMRHGAWMLLSSGNALKSS